MINRIIIPTQDSQGNPPPDNLNAYIKVISEAFGGCTVTEARGAWVKADGSLIFEHTIIVECDTPESQAPFFRTLAQRVKEELAQEAVYYREGEQFPEFI